MSDDNSGQDQTQNDQTGDDNSQNEQQEPYKVFETEDAYKEAQDKFFRGAYNEGKQKQFKDTIKAAQNKLGVDGEFESVEEVFEVAANKVNGSSDDDSGDETTDKEREELKKQLQEYKKKAEQKEQEFQSYKQQQKIDSAINGALNEIKQDNKVAIQDSHLKMLFESDYNVKTDGDSVYVERSNGTPVLDGEGNRQDVSQVLSSFVKENDYANPKAEGLGGGTGGGSVSEKPKFSEFKELMNSGKQDAQKKAAEIRNTANKVGWAEDDSPKNFWR